MLNEIKMPTDKHLIFFEDNDKYAVLTEVRENKYSTLIEWEKSNTKIYNIEYLEGRVIVSMVEKDNQNHLVMIDELTKDIDYLVTSKKTICKITDGVYCAEKTIAIASRELIQQQLLISNKNLIMIDY